ncbi:MAG: hypothetical protein ACYCX9_07960 [Candidatus Dormibacteria bacterium]|jgi:hypothetical protein
MAADTGPPVASTHRHEQFEALISWLRSDEAMELPLREVEKRLQAEVMELLQQGDLEPGPVLRVHDRAGER